LDANPESIPDFSNFSLNLNIINPQITINNFSIYKSSQIKYFMVSAVPLQTEELIYQTKTLYNGNYELQVANGNAPFFVVIDYAYSSSWNILGHGTAEVTRIDTNYTANYFYINNTETKAGFVVGSLTTLSVEYHSLTSYMLVVSVVELTIFSCLYVFLTYFKKNKSTRSGLNDCTIF
jgi:hypothetical protein